MRIRHLCIGLAAALTTSMATAGAWTAKLPVTSVNINETYEGLFIKQSTMMASLPDAGACNMDLYYLPRSHIFFKEIYAMLIAARQSGKGVLIYLEGCAAGGGSRPRVATVVEED